LLTTAARKIARLGDMKRFYKKIGINAYFPLVMRSWMRRNFLQLFYIVQFLIIILLPQFPMVPFGF
jgi:hypothetical protein